MSRRKRALRAYRESEVVPGIAMVTVAVWLLVAFPLWMHFGSLDLPPVYPLVLAWAVGGFVACFLYLVVACE